MNVLYETQFDNLTISTDRARLDLDAITEMLSRAYWAKGRTKDVITRCMQQSLVFGIYDSMQQVGLARVITDYTTFAWLCDVFVHEDYRGRGIGKWLMQSILDHPDLQGLRRFVLATRDAHGLYSQYGFSPLATPNNWMEKFNG